ncbi:hypothetical protein U8335_13775 [Roseiconus lacunae]|uniref:hypothetical protein n=1 Tax=Roseiconus lacunae TaxID=2605694 RepID=UPI0030852457|nr:hypothetical protein U8335_13775 [Stieleria sp. HD01]
MASAARAFDQHRGGASAHSASDTSSIDASDPFARSMPSELPPMMFQLRLGDGRWLSYAYHDVREIECRDAGHLRMTLATSPKTSITIEGRNLRDLATLLSLASVRWIREADPRAVSRPEDQSEVIRITIESDKATK